MIAYRAGHLGHTRHSHRPTFF